jgi:hypothetical protein
MVAPLQSNDGTVAGAWSSGYNGISRCNKALAVLNTLTDEEMPSRKVRIAELRFLRGHWMFLLKRLFKYPVYVDETMTNEDILGLSNREYTNDELWDLIATDFQFGVENLPETQPEIGRANKYAAAAYLAKSRLYQAYEQDESHNVININAAKLEEVIDMCDVVINSGGKYDLFDNFGKIFTYGYDNGIESIFSIQYSKDDGTVSGKIDLMHFGDYSMAPGYGCCHANVPTQNVVNAFKTDANGLPMFDTFNDWDLDDPAEFQTNNIDPRLDHTVGIPSHPFKYDETFVYDSSWARTPSVYGYYSSMKQTQLPTSPSFKNIGFIGSSKNWDILRYADVLLMKAEALIELNREGEALPLINRIRGRAANTDWLKYDNGTTFSNYNISAYEDGVNCIWDQNFARKALQWERRLEFATESSRFYDLVRWGIAAETINEYFQAEKVKRPYLNGAVFTAHKNEYFPIPYSQIRLSKELYVQNTNF